MEAKFIGLCERNKIKLTDTETALSHKIKQHAQDIVDGACEYAGAYAAAAALVVCACLLNLYQSLFHLLSSSSFLCTNYKFKFLVSSVSAKRLS